MNHKSGWFTTVSWGSGPYPLPPRGPWHTREEAEAAWSRWAARVGSLAGTIIAAHSARIVGPFPSRRLAQWADISNYHHYLSKETP
jgi:hypothetical protein